MRLAIRVAGGTLHNSYLIFEEADDVIPGEYRAILYSPGAYVEEIYYLVVMRTEYGTGYYEYHWEGYIEPTHVEWPKGNHVR